MTEIFFNHKGKHRCHSFTSMALAKWYIPLVKKEGGINISVKQHLDKGSKIGGIRHAYTVRWDVIE